MSDGPARLSPVVDRWLLNTFPLWALVLLLPAITMSIGLGGFFALHRFVPSYRANADSRSLSSAFSMSAALFSFVLAFTIGQLYGNFTRANSDVRQEATAVAQMLRNAKGLPPDLRVEVRKETLDYAAEVRTNEWPLMRNGNVSVGAWHDLDHVYATLERARPRETKDPFYNPTISALDKLVSARQTRLNDINLSIPPLFQAVLLIGALLAIFGTFYFKPIGEPIQLVMIGAACALVGVALLTALSLDFPFSGSISVSSDPFQTSTLLLLSGGA